jgi:hypothetical protein
MKTCARFSGILLFLLLTVAAANSAADRYVHGRVVHKDGLACHNCCSVQAELSDAAADTMNKSVSLASASAQHQRDHMQGEVDRDYAFVQSYSVKAVSGGHTFTAQIKIRRAGSYVVIAGFFKGVCWHKGSFSGTKFFKATRAQGEAGDVVSVTIENVPEPPANKQNTVGVFDSTDDICTKG